MRSRRRTPDGELESRSLGLAVSPAQPGGERERFEDLVESFGSVLLSYFQRRLGDQADAADLLADTLLTAWRRMEDVPAGDDAKLWLYGVARNNLANHRRRSKRASALSDRLRQELINNLAVVEQPTGPRVVAVTEALSRLRPTDRELLTLVGWDGLSTTEAASVLGIAPGTARVRAHRARTRLALELTRSEGGFTDGSTSAFPNQNHFDLKGNQ